MRKCKRRALDFLLAVLVCCTVLATPAFAVNNVPEDDTQSQPTAPEVQEPSQPAAPEVQTPQSTVPETQTPSTALTPEGNMTLVDNFVDGNDMQFITVVTKSGSYFYIIIDKSGDGENTVHFLNQVDEADLLALMEDSEAAPAACTCAAKCVPGAIDTSCAVCAVNMSECMGKEPEPVEPNTTEPSDPEPGTEPEQKSNGSGLLVVVLALVLAGCGAFFYFKFLKKKPDAKDKDRCDTDEYDYGEDHMDLEAGADDAEDHFTGEDI